jgi:hypothetical protein
VGWWVALRVGRRQSGLTGMMSPITLGDELGVRLSPHFISGSLCIFCTFCVSCDCVIALSPCLLESGNTQHIGDWLGKFVHRFKHEANPRIVVPRNQRLRRVHDLHADSSTAATVQVNQACAIAQSPCY